MNYEIFYKQFKDYKTINIPLKKEDPLRKLKDKYNIYCEDKNKLYGSGYTYPVLMIIGYKPSNFEYDVGRVFSDKYNIKINGLLSYINKYVDIINKVYFSNVYLCDECNNSFCKNKIFDEIKIIKPKSILLIGDKTGKHFNLEEKGKNIIKIDKYYQTFLTYDMKTLFFKREQVKEEIREHLNSLIKYLKVVDG